MAVARDRSNCAGRPTRVDLDRYINDKTKKESVSGSASPASIYIVAIEVTT